MHVIRQGADDAIQEVAETAPTRRDRHKRLTAERGRMAWQRVGGPWYQALEWVVQHRAAMVALVVVLALTLLAGRRR